jgi:hypothetical protein
MVTKRPTKRTEILPAPRSDGQKPLQPESAALDVSIDFPAEGEGVQTNHYAVRVCAPGATEVELSIDGSAWTACRSAVGFFWYDWYPKEAGAHRLAARARIGTSSWKSSGIRACKTG